MTMSRRKTISLLGGGTILAALGAGGTFAGTRTPSKAIAPWGLAGGYDDPRLNALSFGLLAPNPHNLQPWHIALEGEDAFVLRHDQSRRLPETDPFDRQIMIGMGCLLEQTVLAAGAAGYDVALEIMEEGPQIARATLSKGGLADPLAAHILQRRSCKEPFADRAVPADLAGQLAPFADIHTDPRMVSALRELTFEAWMVETTTPHTMQESIDLMRMGKAEINAKPDGLDIGGAFLEGLMLAGVLTRDAMADQNSTAFQQGIDIYREMLMATPAYVALTSETNTRSDHIAAGRAWLRLNLKTTALGLSLHPVSQALQEYPEMAPHYASAHGLLAPQGHTVQMLGRLGYGPQTARTPRWPLEEKLIV